MGWLEERPRLRSSPRPGSCALLAFTLNTGAYTAEIVRGAVLNMPKGQIEAANAFGMSRWQTLTRIILPNSFRRALPAYSNEVIFMLQGSAVAGIITIVDLTGAARIINSRYYSPFEALPDRRPALHAAHLRHRLAVPEVGGPLARPPAPRSV